MSEYLKDGISTPSLGITSQQKIDHLHVERDEEQISTPSLGITPREARPRARQKDHDPDFNSLSRDHAVDPTNSDTAGANFNSLSRDHFSTQPMSRPQHLVFNFNSLSRDHGGSRSLFVSSRVFRVISTPSLGITEGAGASSSRAGSSG
jgi:hypothetical protein